jgi:hypothetical protein
MECHMYFKLFILAARTETLFMSETCVKLLPTTLKYEQSYKNRNSFHTYGLGDRGSRVRFPAGTENFSLHYRVQNGSGAHPAPI